MEKIITIKLDGETPIFATAIHDGHIIREDLLDLSGLTESERLREEDPFTGIWTNVTDNRIIAHHSRFEYDLNRPPEKAIYLLPADAWGLKVWNVQPDRIKLAKSLQTYHKIYELIHKGLTELVDRFGSIVVFDLHSYNHRRNGPDAPAEDPALNPEINIGTGTMNRDFWSAIVNRFIKDLKAFNFQNRHLDVRENVKFKGGYFPRWVHENFQDSVCCISIEMKKFFMDEWTGAPDHETIADIGEALKSTIPGVLHELSKKK